MASAASKAVPVAIVAIIIVVGIATYFLIASRPAVKEFTLRMREYGFEGSKGGPTLRVKVGDNVRINLKNEGGIPHDFWIVENIDKAVEETKEKKERSFLFGASVQNVDAGQESRLTFKLDRSGSFFYVCLQLDPEIHARLGMFGELVVQP